MVVRACNPSYSGDWGKRITWTQKAEVAVSHNHTIALQPGWQSKAPSEKEKEKGIGYMFFNELNTIYANQLQS